jgi:hypothetical protein
VIERAARAYLSDGYSAGARALAPIAGEIWPGMSKAPRSDGPREARTVRQVKRASFSKARAAATYARDHFHCRYCGRETMPLPFVELLSDLYPEELPYGWYRRGETHPVYWTRVCEADHHVAGAEGGSWTDPENHATACVWCNTRKRTQAGWQLLGVPDSRWDGLTRYYRPVWERAGRPRAPHHGSWLRVFETVGLLDSP